MSAAAVAAQAGGAVSYPGLPSHPQHALLQRLANPGYGHGGLLTLVPPPCAPPLPCAQRDASVKCFSCTALLVCRLLC